MENLNIKITKQRLEPGTHVLRKSIATISEHVVVIPAEECKETRPDMGMYFPAVTFSAIERSLRKRGLLPYQDNDHSLWISVV